MHIKLTLTAGAIALLLPVTALAYFSPNEFDGGTVNQNLQQPPPNARETTSVVQARQKAIRDQQAAAQQAQLHAAAAEEEDNNFIPTMAEPKVDKLSDEYQYQLRLQRMQEAKNQAGPTIIIGGNGAVIDSQGNVLHSGAPLITSSGPESFIAIVAGFLSILCTLVYVRRRSQSTHSIHF